MIHATFFIFGVLSAFPANVKAARIDLPLIGDMDKDIFIACCVAIGVTIIAIILTILNRNGSIRCLCCKGGPGDEEEGEVGGDATEPKDTTAPSPFAQIPPNIKFTTPPPPTYPPHILDMPSEHADQHTMLETLEKEQPMAPTANTHGNAPAISRSATVRTRHASNGAQRHSHMTTLTNAEHAYLQSLALDTTATTSKGPLVQLPSNVHAEETHTRMDNAYKRGSLVGKKRMTLAQELMACQQGGVRPGNPARHRASTFSMGQDRRASMSGMPMSRRQTLKAQQTNRHSWNALQHASSLDSEDDVPIALLRGAPASVLPKPLTTGEEEDDVPLAKLSGTIPYAVRLPHGHRPVRAAPSSRVNHNNSTKFK